MKRKWHWHKGQSNNNNNSDSYKIDNNNSSFGKPSYTEPEIIVPLHKRLSRIDWNLCISIHGCGFGYV
ncbi:MAG: hypothetical protein ACJ71O_18300 [Nitrososphaeraceae archaeon]